MNEVEQRVAIVTGASRGIGAAIAERLAGDGFRVVLNYVGSDALVKALVAKIETARGRAIACKADVSDPSAVKQLFDDTEAAFGPVDVLVNSAGIMKLGKLADIDDKNFDQHVAINLKGTFNTLREAARRLRPGGRIINLSSSVVGLRFETYAVYAATKAAVETMTAILAREMRGRSISVNAIAPGPTGTDLFLSGKSKELIDELAHLSPLERLGTPEDVARVASFLAGPEGGWVNGQTVRVNGGVI